MKIHHLLQTSALLFSLVLIIQCQEAETPPTEKVIDPYELEGWTLTWQDEFDGDSVDVQKWVIADGHWSHNGEEQYYAPDEVYVEDGNLRLRSRYRQYHDQSFTSGHIHSQYFQRYGRIDISARLPGTKGMWPALWLLSANGGWPPEIDILELLGHEPNTVHMSAHWGPLENGQKPWEIGQTATAHFTGPDFTQDFHLFTLEWYPDSLRWLIDDVVRFKSLDGIPHEPMYLIMNTAVGGFWPGSPDGTTILPLYDDIEYVRFYELNEEN